MSRQSSITTALLLTAFFASACSSDSPAAAGESGSGCLARDRALQGALDRARQGTPSRESALAVQTADCGLSVFVSADQPVAADSHAYRIASVTKTFVAGVVLKLAADGKIGLDDGIAAWLPDLPNAQLTSVRHLLSHRSGLFDYVDDLTFQTADKKRVYRPSELLTIAAGHPPSFAPGTAYQYSNTNYIALGLIAENVGGAKIGDLIRTRLLRPAGLVATYFEGEEPPIGTLAKGFDARDQDVTTAYDLSGAWAAGAMVATASDLAKWVTLLGSGEVHNPAIQAQLEDAHPTGAMGLSYGLGVFEIAPSLTGGAGPAIGHMGDIFGYHNQSFYFPERKFSVVAIVTSDAASPNEVSVAALRVLLSGQ